MFKITYPVTLAIFIVSALLSGVMSSWGKKNENKTKQSILNIVPLRQNWNRLSRAPLIFTELYTLRFEAPYYFNDSMTSIRSLFAITCVCCRSY